MNVSSVGVCPQSCLVGGNVYWRIFKSLYLKLKTIRNTLFWDGIIFKLYPIKDLVRNDDCQKLSILINCHLTLSLATNVMVLAILAIACSSVCLSVCLGFFFFFLRSSAGCLRTHLLDQASLKLNAWPCLPSAGIKGVCHHVWLYLVNFLNCKI